MAVVTDPISDMLTRIRNAHQALHKDVSIPKSKLRRPEAPAAGGILQQEGYITSFTVGPTGTSRSPSST